ncbi:hypothetical protein HHL11_03075 [Ramlibacter sp. G-1-2-2]|uniref:Uncharacterized protein n=1 Tax=Ramlibacter agri TaxID=2728837 RepID=A0A848H4P4_9BURK|nr:hypothetical protein [Ramlibacter agri]NML42718.1 hypothetical protein [Ramlibacter agri]
MNKIIVYVDDAAWLRQQLPPPEAVTHWVVVACAPRMTHRISKWVSHSARENWRSKWADKLFDQVIPDLQARGDVVTPVLARGPLPELTRLLMAEHSTEQVLDVRRPKTQDSPSAGRWQPGAIMGLAAMLLFGPDGEPRFSFALTTANLIG